MADNPLSILRSLQKMPMNSLKAMNSEALTTASFYLSDLDRSTSGKSGKAFDSMRGVINKTLKERGVTPDFESMGPGPFSKEK